MPSITDPEAIAANRRGDITAEQREALVSAMQKSSALGCILTIILVVALVKLAGDWLSQNEVIGGIAIIAALIFSFLVAADIAAIPVRRRLMNARAEAVNGEVMWRGSNYTPVAEGRTLKIFSTSSRNLAVGHYRFYRLEHSDWLLSAEPLQGAAAVSPVSSSMGGFGGGSVVGVPQGNFTESELVRALAATREYHADSLETNRDGRMTAGQRVSLLRESFSLLVFGVGAFVLMVFVIISAIKGTKDMSGLLLGVGFLALVGAFCLYSMYNDIADALSGRVEMVSGRGGRHIHHTSGGRSSSTTYYYDIGGMSFSVSHTGYNALIEGVVYRAYYAPRTKKLVNFEPGDGSSHQSTV